MSIVRTTLSLTFVPAALTLALAQETQDAARFHHLHLNSPTPGTFADFYARLFDSRHARRVTRWGAEGVESDGVYLLFDQNRAGSRTSSSSGIWHFGWGTTTLDESYVSHLRNEVTWEIPIPKLTSQFHVHLVSADPASAADWYRRHLGGLARIAEADGPPTSRNLEGWPLALVRFDKISLIIYPHRGDEPLVGSRGHTVDHLAFAYPDLERALARFRAAKVPVVQDPYSFGETRGAMLEGPDGVAIELIQVPANNPLM